MPEQCGDGSVVLSTQGLPYSVVGSGDLLALFRCVSCRYRFSTDILRPQLMGLVGTTAGIGVHRVAGSGVRGEATAVVLGPTLLFLKLPSRV